MTEQELQQARCERWRLDGRGMRAVEEARDFIESAGMCLLYPVKPPVLAPTFLGAFAGTDEELPDAKHAFADPRAREATELMVRLLREKSVFEANVFGEAGFLVSATAFPYLYGIIGDKSPRQAPKPGAHSDYSPLARDAFEAIRTRGAMSKKRLQQTLGGEPSGPALDRALNELWFRLRITRVDYTPEEGARWDALYRWAPERVQRGLHLSQPEALSALVSKYLEAVVAAEPGEVEEFFGRVVPKSRVREAINALLAERELSLVTIGKKSMLQVAVKREAFVARPRRKISG
jgi:23S rRNA pseudouridine2605 synthase